MLHPASPAPQQLARAEGVAQLALGRLVGLRRDCDRQARFLQRFANRRDPCRAVLVGVAERGGKRMIAGINPPPGEDERSGGKGEAARALDDQQLWRWTGHIANDDQGRSRNGRGQIIHRCGLDRVGTADQLAMVVCTGGSERRLA